MDRNLILAFALSMAVFSGWLAYQDRVHGPERRAAAEAARQAAAEAEAGKAGTDREPAAGTVDLEDPSGISKLDAAPRGEPGVEAAAGGLADEAAEPAVAPWTGSLEVGAVRAEFSNRGASITRWQLKNWFETPNEEVPVELIDLVPPDDRALTTPFSELGLGDWSDAYFEVEREGDNEIVFAHQRKGIRVRKTYRVAEGEESYRGYAFSLSIEVENRSERILEPRFAVHWPAAIVDDRADFKNIGLLALADDEVTREPVASVGSPGFLSGIFGNGDEGPTTLDVDVKWAGVDLTYFVGLLIPSDEERRQVVFAPLERGKSARAEISYDPLPLLPGQRVARRYDGYFGPKQPDLLAQLGHRSELSISRGWSWVAPLTTFFGWVLHVSHRVVPNYGVAIILITLLVRLATWPIMAKQMKSAERMRELMPRIKEIQEKHKDDKQKQSEATFALYRETGVNPLGGCLPMLLQLPVFIGLFYALQSSIDLRHAPFFGWINDLSAPATLFTIPGVGLPVRLLPILMGISMYAQQKMTPQTGMDPAQAKMMLIMMPGMMLVISYGFPSGLVLYWMVSNLLGIGHQLLVRRKMQQQESS